MVKPRAANRLLIPVLSAANNHAWVATGSSLVLLATDGTTFATCPIAASNVAAGNGHIFANVGPVWGIATVEKIQP